MGTQDDNIRYAKGPVVYLYDRKALDTGKNPKKKQVLWGDRLRIGADINNEWSKVKYGGNTFAIKKEDYQKERILEIIFLDVGQGDGCILTTPKDGKVIIIDAGKGKHILNFLNWRFDDFKEKFKFHAAIITHPDKDHYLGFQKIFENKQISFEHVYHNGLMERKGDNRLGPGITKKNQSGNLEIIFYTDIRPTKNDVENLYKNEEVRGKMPYPKLMRTALDSGRVDDISMLSTEHGQKKDNRTWLPGFVSPDKNVAPPSDSEGFTIEVLGPVFEEKPNGKKGLRTFGDDGKTKNGHSILLRLQYCDFSVLFGGDLNTPAERFLMRHYGNDGKNPTDESMVEKARQRFGVDMMKCCHHGASDVTDEFLEATNPIAYVVSSGDEESYVHPRPDLLGLLGKKGRGSRPLILCTELLRSTREKSILNNEIISSKINYIRKKSKAINSKISDFCEKHSRTDKIISFISSNTSHLYEATVEKTLKKISIHNVETYGAINLRTDGQRAVIAFLKERSSGVNRWFFYKLEKDEKGNFEVTESR